MNDLGLRAGLAAALFAGFSVTLAACPGPAPSTGTGAAGGSGSTSDTVSASTSSTTSTSSTSSTSTTSTSTGVICSVPGDCPHPPACQQATCDNGACGTMPTDPGSQCSDKGGAVCDGVGNCVECVVPTDCVDPTTPPPACSGTTYNAPPKCDLVTHKCMDVDPVDCSVTHQICTPLGCDSCTVDGDCGPIVAGSCTKNACMGGACAVIDRPQGGDCMGGTCNGKGACVQRRYVFVTSAANIPPTFGSATHASMMCQSAASSVGLNGTWKAWITDATSSPAQWTTTNLQVPYYLLDDTTPVAQNFMALTTMNLDHAIDLDEKGNTLTAGVAWTGSKASGTSTSTNCLNWTSTVTPNTGTVGDVTATDPTWSALPNGQSCTMSARLYCFQQ